jgi:hypothetical protein
MVPVDSDRVSPAPPYSGYPSSITDFAYGTFTPFGRLFQTVLLAIDRIVQVLQPQDVNTLVWALPRSLATTYGIIVIFFSSAYLDVSVQRVADFVYRSSNGRVAPFGHLRIERSFAPTRSFSQLTTSFVVVYSLGIPHAPLLCFHLLRCRRRAFNRTVYFPALHLPRVASTLLFILPSLVKDLSRSVRPSSSPCLCAISRTGANCPKALRFANNPVSNQLRPLLGIVATSSF